MSRFRTWKRNLFPKVAPLVYFLVRALGNSLKFRTLGWERYANEPRPIIFAGWHGRSMLATLLFRKRGYWIIVSHSRDGELQNKLFRRFGFQTIRGSTGREGVKAAIEAIRVLKTGAKMALTPDGPRGPSKVLQPGILMLAQKSGALIVPVGCSANRRWIANSWDKYMIPKPFSKAIMVFADPIEIPPTATPEDLDNYQKTIEQALNEVEAKAELEMGHGA